MSKDSKEVKPFNYFDSPDGEDILPKLGVVAKPAILTAFALSTIDVALYSHPKGYMQTLGRYLHFGWPVLGATTAFVITHNLAGSIRKKDDKLNWFLGGVASGSVFGVWRKSIAGGFAVAGALGMLAVLQKFCVQNGYELTPSKFKPEYGGLWSVNQDWTLTKQIPGNWTTGEK